MPATTGGRNTSKSKRSNYRPPPKAPSPGGHPSRGGTTVSGGTKKRPKTKPYVSPTPSVKEQRNPSRPAPKSQPGPISAKERKNKIDSARGRKAVARGRRVARKARREREMREDLVRTLQQTRKKLDPGDGPRRSISQDLKALNRPSKTSYRRSTTGARTPGSAVNLDKVARPASKILDQTTRPFEVLAGIESEYLKTGLSTNPAKALEAGYKSGITREKTVRGKDLVKQVGVKNETVQNVAGTALEIAGDPLTYVPVGRLAKGATSASRAIRAGKRAAKKTAPKRAALPTPKERAAARKARSRAARKAYAKSRNRSNRVGATGEPVVLGRDKASKVIPVRKSDITPKQKAALDAADRERRGVEMAESRRASKKARAVRRAAKGQRTRMGRRPMPVEQSDRIRDALEANDLSRLTARERRAAKMFRQETERQYHAKLAAAREAGEKPPPRYRAREEGEPEGYVPRVDPESVADRGTRKRLSKSGQKITGEAKRGAPQGSRVRTTTLKDRMRTDRRPAAEVRRDNPEQMVADLETTLAASGQKAAAIQATTIFRNAVRQMGRPAKPNAKLKPNEGVFEVHSTGTKLEIREVKDAKQMEKANELVVLPRPVAREAMNALESAGHHPVLDLPTHYAKWALTVPNPQYWARNLYGGLHNVWQEGVPARSLPKAIAKGARVNRAVTKMSKAEELGKPMGKAGRRTIKVGKAGKMRLKDFVDELERYNVSGQGQTVELLGSRSAPRHIAQSAEDLPRVTAYYHFRSKGLSPREASQRVQNSQFDYGQLTKFEKQWARRIMPFYTWRSRNIAFQAKTLVERPGKMATIEKLRDLAAEEADMPANWEEKLTKGEGLQLPIPIPVDVALPGGMLLAKKGDLAYAALPVTDLNLLGSNPLQWAEQVGQMANPIVKNPIEFATGYSFYWRDNLEGDYRRWRPAPFGASNLLDNMTKPVQDGFAKAGIIRKNGKGEWEWRGKTDYLAKMLPITSLAAMGATGDDKAREDFKSRALGWVTGVRAKEYRPKANDLQKMWDKRGDLETKQKDLSELDIDKKKNGSYTAENIRLKNEINRISWQIYDLSKRLGEKASKPGTRRDKVYTKGYNPEDPDGNSVQRRLGMGRGSGSNPGVRERLGLGSGDSASSESARERLGY